MYGIKMASGTVYDATAVGEAKGYLHLHIINGAKIQGVVAEFSNPENTREIIHLFGHSEISYTGYTTLIRVAKEKDGVWFITLQKTEEATADDGC